VLNQLELRYYYDKKGFVFAFFDQAFAERFKEGNFSYPSGFGLGINLDTKSGLFKFAYAFGNSSDQEIALNSAKIHFGYAATF
jgi:hypothetical protein